MRDVRLPTWEREREGPGGVLLNDRVRAKGVDPFGQREMIEARGKRGYNCTDLRTKNTLRTSPSERSPYILQESRDVIVW